MARHRNGEGAGVAEADAEALRDSSSRACAPCQGSRLAAAYPPTGAASAAAAAAAAASDDEAQVLVRQRFPVVGGVDAPHGERRDGQRRHLHAGRKDARKVADTSWVVQPAPGVLSNSMQRPKSRTVQRPKSLTRVSASISIFVQYMCAHIWKPPVFYLRISHPPRMAHTMA